MLIYNSPNSSGIGESPLNKITLTLNDIELIREYNKKLYSLEQGILNGKSLKYKLINYKY